MPGARGSTRSRRSGTEAVREASGTRAAGGSGTMAAMRGLHALVLSVAVAAAAADPGGASTLVVANRKVFTFRATSVGSAPAERLANAQARLEQVPIRGPVEKVETHPLQLGTERGTAVMVGTR